MGILFNLGDAIAYVYKICVYVNIKKMYTHPPIGTNISFCQGTFESMIFPFPVGYGLVPGSGY